MVDAKELAMRPKKAQPTKGKKQAPSHGKMLGLNNDDHVQYLTVMRGDKRYYTKKEIDMVVGGLPFDFYTKEVVDDLLAAAKKSLMASVSKKANKNHEHKTEHDVGHLHDLIQTKADEDHVHSEIYSNLELRGGALDDRYYTEQEIEVLLDKIHVALDGKSPVGHKHTNYYTKKDLDSGKLDSLYFTRKELDLILSTKADTEHEHRGSAKSDSLLAGALDVRYYTKDDLNSLFDTISRDVEKIIKTHDHRSYCSKSELDKGLLDKRYYPKDEVNKLINETIKSVGSEDHSHREYLETREFGKHLSKINAEIAGLAKYSHDHPEIINALKDLYYTEAEVNERLKSLNTSLTNVIDNVIEEALLIKELVDIKADVEHKHNHSDMWGLVEDNHPQYILSSGDRELLDDWDIGAGKQIKADCIKARSNDGLKILNNDDFGLVIEGNNQMGLGTEPVEGWPVTIPSNPAASAGLLITDTQGHRAYMRSSEAGVWLGSLSNNKVLFTVGGTSSNNVFLECGTDKVLRVPERLVLKEGTAINEFSVDGTLSGNSSFAVPTEKAVRTYVEQKVSSMNSFVFKTRHGKNKLQKGSTTHTIYFDKDFDDDDYVINISIVNTDETPKFYNWVVTSLTEDGFSIAFSEKIASKNCEIHWTAIHN